MAESSQVRLLQHHLRQAGTSLAARQYDAASTHIAAALAIDPASLAALTLRQRLEAQRAAQRPGATPISPAVQPEKPDTNRFVPPGVNAASWLDFEQRIQERRYRGLIDAAERAVAAGDGVAARAAVEEARELQPDSGDVVRLSARIAMLQIPAAAANEGLFRSRTFRAVSLLLLGVTLLMGLDWVRSGAKQADTRQVAASIPAPEPVVVENNETTTAPSTEATPADSPERLPLTYRSVATSAAAPTAGNEPAPVAVDRPPATFERAENDSTTARLAPAAPIVRGEVSDDYVAPRFAVRQSAPEREQPTANASARPPATTPLASVVRQPAPIFESIAPAPTPAAAAAAAAPATIPAPSVTAPVTPPPAPAGVAIIAPSRVSEDSRVTAVVNQYASAYGQLDAAAVRSIWPSVDERALSRAFANLSSQSMSFDACDITVTGPTARASCRGRASYVPRIGSQEKHDEPRKVQFELRRDGDAWKITRAVTSR